LNYILDRLDHLRNYILNYLCIYLMFASSKRKQSVFHYPIPGRG
jgi:hypothetical protein